MRHTLSVALVLASVLASSPTWAAPVVHPLEPLSSAEIGKVQAAVSAHAKFPKGALFPMIALKEPPKAKVLAWKPTSKLAREALAIVLDRSSNKTFEVVIDVTTGKVGAFTERPGVQPLVLVEEYETVPKLVKADPRWQEAMKKRGITDFGKVWIEVWANGTFVPAGQEGARLLRGLSFLQDGDVNFYGRPIEGVTAVVNMNTGKLVELTDTGVVPIAAKSQQLDEKSIGPQRKVKPLTVVQSEGPGFTANGHEVKWQNWQFRWALHPREGLTLYQVAYQDGAKLRSIMYRGAVSEMVVPYGDPDVNWAFRNAFDEGEYGLGRLASPLEAGQDAPANAVYFNADFSDDFGKPYTLKNVVGLFERDVGVLWKHYDIYHDQNQTRRARQLVLTNIVTIGNYDYAINWIFHQDGTLEVDAALTGFMLVKGVKAKVLSELGGHHGAANGHLVAPNIVAPHHQHFFNFRLDLDVDGTSNTPLEMNTRAAPAGADNPHGNAIVMTDTLLATESMATRDMNMAEARAWLVRNPGKKNKLGYSPGYALAPGGNSVVYLSPESKVRQRAGFVNHHFWATRFKDDEIYGAGVYPNQGKLHEGLPAYVKNDEKLDKQDVVIWYTMGLTHIPRPEEWPMMSVHHIGFKLLPVGFFEQFPALDVPR